MASYYGYLRVSSLKQWKKGTYKEQSAPVVKYLLEHGVTEKQLPDHIYKDHYSGVSMSRPHFNEMMKRAKNGDTVVVAKLDRLSRNGLNAMNFIKKHPHITFVSLSPSLILSGDNSKSVKLMNDIMLLFTQFDHDIVMDRFNRGKAMAKAMGKRNWNGGIAPRFYGKKRKYYINIYNYAQTHSVRNTAQTFNMSRRNVNRIKVDGEAYFTEKANEYIKKHHESPNQTKIDDFIKK